MRFLIVVFLVTFAKSVTVSGGSLISSRDDTKCSIDLDKRTGRYLPFLLKNSNELAYPEGSRILNFAESEKVTLFCHGTEIRPNFLDVDSLRLEMGNNQRIELVCNQNKEFTLNGDVIGMDKIYAATCTRILEPLIIREEESDCSGGLGADNRTSDLGTIVLAKVGWNLGNDFFHEQFSACIDEGISGTLWTQHTVIGKSIDYRDKESGRPSFRIDNRGYHRFFDFTTATNIKNSYTKANQVEVINSLLGTNNLNGETIIENTSSGSNYFARGHLSPDAAFIEGVEQDATYFFFNVAPQFQSFNNGNWVALEKATRILAAGSKGNIKVWSGTYGILSYPDLNGNEVPIYLYLDGDGDKKHIPAPKFFWKVLQDETKNQAVAFVGLNDPHADDISPDEAFCNSICHQIAGVDWDIHEEERGHMACCTVQKLREKIPFSPFLGDIDLLTKLE